MTSTATSPTTVFERVAAAASAHVRADRPLRRNLPGGGRLHLDRALPFLVLYRRPPGVLDEGTSELAAALSAYLLASGEARFHAGLEQVANAVAEAARDRLGAFLLLEVRARRERATPEGDGPELPRAVVVNGPDGHASTAERLAQALRDLVLRPEMGGDLGVPERLAAVEVRARGGTAELPPLLDGASETGVFRMGVELTPFYRDPDGGTPFPRVVQALRRALAGAVGEALFAFAQEETALDPPHPRALARTNVERASLHVDRRLGEVAAAFDALVQVTPVNGEEAWQRFRAGGHGETPVFRYRPLPFDPEHLKRRLFHVPIERVESPLLGFLFREKQEELDRQITMLRALETERFFHASAELYGTPDDDLVELARLILTRLPPSESVGQRDDYPDSGRAQPDRRAFLDAEAFARLATDEISRYRRLLPDFLASVEIRPGVAAGLMVSRGVLYVSEHLRVPRERVGALLSHEIGTHLVTYFNGAAQPLRIFASGLAGYDPLQEGIAVLSEYLVGGLNRSRARVLAGRVLAVQSLVEGAGFTETFDLLHKDLGFPPRSAFIVSLRAHRGGGLTKDAAYLQGLRDLLTHLREEGSIDPLLVGKVGLAHAEIVQELVLTGVVRLPVIRPFYTSDLSAMERLGACRRMDVLDLVEEIGS
jgi:uncharacterized protein (TIGR02421 family)